MILVDTRGHMVSTESVAELHEFAEGMGLKRWRFHVGRGHPHYDLRDNAYAVVDAIVAGAALVGTRVLVTRMARE